MSFLSSLNPFSSESAPGESISFTDAQCDDAGFRALKEFHNYSTLKYPQNYSLTLDGLQSAVGKITKQSIGFAILANNFDDRKVADAMDALADKGEGKLPASPNSWFAVIKDVSVHVDFVEALKYTAVASAGDIAQGAQQIGDSVLFSGKLVLLLLPVAVVFILYRKTKAIAG